MKTITMYELLGLLKDDKAPKKIKIDNIIYELDEETNMYFTKMKNCRVALGGLKEEEGNLIFNAFENKVEILEEEKKIPEKIKIEQDTPSSNYYIRNENGAKCALTKHSKMITETLNQVIDYLDYIKSKGDE